MQCTSCGMTSEGNFCPGCGSRLDGADPAGSFWAEDEPTRPQETSEGPWTQHPSSSPWHASSTGPDAPWSRTRPGPSGARTWAVAAGAAVLAVLLLVGLGGGLFWFLSGDDEPTAASVSTESTPTSTSSTTSPDPTTTTVTSTSTTTTVGTPAAIDELNDLREDSLSRLSTDGRWAVTLSAKQDGTRDDRQVTDSGSHVFRLPDILDLHEEYEATHWYSDIYLLRAEDLGSTRGTDDDKIWMTVLDPGYLTSKEEAEVWCELAYPHLWGDDLDNACYPRQLTSP